MPINYQKTYETLSYEEGIEFRNLSIKVIQEIYPHYVVTPAEPQNPDLIYVTNQDDNVRVQFPLRDLYKDFARTGKTKNDLKETILNNYSQILKQIEDFDIEEEEREKSWIEVRDFVQPRLTKTIEFGEDLELYVHLPFGEDLVTSFVIVSPTEEGMLRRIRTEQLEKWEITFDDLYKKAMENFGEVTDGMAIVGSNKPKGILWNENGIEYAASSILLGGIRYLISQNVGSPFRFGIPSSFAFYCWSELDNEEFQTEMRAMIKRQYDSMPASLTTNIYEVDEKGQIKQLKDLPQMPEPPMTSNN